MPRTRYLRPGFHENETLCKLPPLCRIFFQGLWTHADREGRLADRPRVLGSKILPYDECDTESFLKMLTDSGFITRYQVGSERFIQVMNWHTHQRPHKDEKGSTIPAFAFKRRAVNKINVHLDSGAEHGENPGKNGAQSAFNLNSNLNSNSHPGEGEGARPRPPVITDIVAYWAEARLNGSAQAFLDYHTAGGWRIGAGAGKPVKDWKAAARMWSRNEVTFGKTRQGATSGIRVEAPAGKYANIGRRIDNRSEPAIGGAPADSPRRAVSSLGDSGAVPAGKPN